MIGGWLIKVVLGILVLGFLVVELGSPLVARAQADDAAHEVANQTALQLQASFTQETLDRTCRSQADSEEVELNSCQLNGQNEVEVTVTKQARTIFLGKIDGLADWYRAKASASADVQR